MFPAGQTENPEVSPKWQQQPARPVRTCTAPHDPANFSWCGLRKSTPRRVAFVPAVTQATSAAAGGVRGRNIEVADQIKMAIYMDGRGALPCRPAAP